MEVRRIVSQFHKDRDKLLQKTDYYTCCLREVGCCWGSPNVEQPSFLVALELRELHFVATESRELGRELGRDVARARGLLTSLWVLPISLHRKNTLESGQERKRPETHTA